MSIDFYPRPTKKAIYHVFTNEQDEWVGKKEAMELFDLFKTDTGSARLYSTEWNDEDGIWEDVDCVKSFGSYPR